MYRLRILDDAERELAQLDKNAGKRVVKRLRWLAKNLATIQPEPLKGRFAGFCKLRIGDLRAIYQVLYQEDIVVVHAIGNRREIYRRKNIG